MRIVLIYLKLFFQVPYYLYRIWRYGLDEETFVRAGETSAETKPTAEEQGGHAPASGMRLAYLKHHAEAFAFIKEATTKVNKAGLVTVEAAGAEKLPAENGFVMYCNHQGLFDTLVFFQACPKPFAFLAKKEVKNIILLKQIIAALGAYTLDRKNLRQQMGIINNVAADVKRGKNFLIFPEGTRSRQPNAMGEFKGGSFKAATKARCPIVPCALIDSHKPFDSKLIRPVTVKLRFLEPLIYEEYKGMKTVEIAAIVKARIEAAMAEMLES